MCHHRHNHYGIIIADLKQKKKKKKHHRTSQSGGVNDFWKKLSITFEENLVFF